MRMLMLALLMLSVSPAFAQDKPTDYKTAFYRAQSGDKPLLVIVTAEWCTPCQLMKTTTLPELTAKHAFKDFHYATVDYDAQPDLAQKLIGDRGLPQMIIYEKSEGQWIRRFLAGPQSVASVESFIRQTDSLRTAEVRSEKSKNK